MSRVDGLRFGRAVLRVPPWPLDLALIRDTVFPDSFASDSRYPDEDRVVAAQLGGETVGYITADEGLDEDDCYLQELVVVPAFRRQQIGRRLVSEMAKWLLADGFVTAYVYPLEDDDLARRVVWFEGMGFRKLDSEPIHCIRVEQLVAHLERTTGAQDDGY